MVASNYDEALRRLLAHEGGYSNHPSDPGGPTNFGITIGDFRRYVKQDATEADVRAMRPAQAQQIYRTKYWNALNCDRLPPGVDYAVFDYGVHSGTARVATVLRRLVGAKAGAAIDAATLALLAGRDASALIAELCDERLAFLQRLKTWPTFGRGWARRVAEVRAAAMAMAAAGADAARSAPSLRSASAAQSQGKAVAPINRAAQRASAGAVIASGAVAAERAHAAGASFTFVTALIVGAIAIACGAWWCWRWRQRRQQLRTAIDFAKRRCVGSTARS